jgi:hypothetical protein
VLLSEREGSLSLAWRWLRVSCRSLGASIYSAISLGEESGSASASACPRVLYILDCTGFIFFILRFREGVLIITPLLIVSEMLVRKYVSPAAPYLVEIVHVELTDEGGKLAVAEILVQHLLLHELNVHNFKRTFVDPAYSVFVLGGLVRLPPRECPSASR